MRVVQLLYAQWYIIVGGFELTHFPCFPLGRLTSRREIKYIIEHFAKTVQRLEGKWPINI